MYINSKIFYHFILFSRIKNQNRIYGYALFFENASLLLLLLLNKSHVEHPLVRQVRVRKT